MGMSVAGSENLVQRPSARPLAWALLISLAVHLTAFVLVPVTYAVLVKMAIIAKPAKTFPLQPQKPPPPPQQELPLTFVEVDPTQAVKEAPKNAKYYSSQNSKAANPDATLETSQPKIDGTQTHVPKTQSADKPKAFPLQPAPKPPAPVGEEQAKPKTGPKVGDLAMAKPAEKPAEKPADAQVGEPPQHVRPRTLAQAEAQNMMQGQKMKQDGGVKNQLHAPSLDAKGMAFGAYDQAFIDAVSTHWYALVDAQHNSEMRTGRVVLDFNLNSDGRITDMKVIEGDEQNLMTYLCQRAILDPAPFEPWPVDMRRIIGSDKREVRFTFYYE